MSNAPTTPEGGGDGTDDPQARERRRALALVIGGQVFVLTSSAGMRMALPLMLLRDGGLWGLGGAMSAGLVVALFALVPVFTAMPAGRWVDRRGYHRPIYVSVVLSVLGALLAVPAGLLGEPAVLHWLGAMDVHRWDWARALLLLLCAGLTGTSNSLGTICVQRTVGRLAMMTTHGPEGRPLTRTPAQEAAQTAELKRAFSWLGVGPSISNSSGPMLAGLCIDAWGYAAAFVACALLPLFTFVSAWRVSHRVAGSSPRVVARVRGRGWAGVRELLGVPSMQRLLLINWLFIGSWDMFAFLVPLHGHALALSASVIGLVLGIQSVAILGVRLLLPLVSDRIEDARLLAGALAMMGLGFGLFPWAGTAPLMMLFAVVVGLGLGVLQPMILSTLYRITPPERQGEALGLRMVCLNLSSSILPLCFGALGTALGAAVMFRGMSLVLLAGSRLPRGLRQSTG